MPSMRKLTKSLQDPQFAADYKKDPVKAVEGSLGRPLTEAEKDGVCALKFDQLQKIVEALQPRASGVRARPD